MRVRWRNFELPSRIICKKETLKPDFGEFIAEPFERGFGNTIGNSLRRVLLSAIEGSAVTSVKISGVQHEFSTIPGVVEDVADIILNVKKIRLSIEDEVPVKLQINVNKKGEVTAGDITSDAKIKVANKDLVIATLDKKVEFQMELDARRGRGYVTAEENSVDPQEIGIIPVASSFTPIRHVKYTVENTRVGKITNYDRLILSITTDGTISPEMALVEASKILRKHLNPFVQYLELGQELPREVLPVEISAVEEEQDNALKEKLDKSIKDIELSARALNCLESAEIRSVRDLVTRTEDQIMEIRSLGKNTLNEIKERLEKINLSLGMAVEPVVPHLPS